MAHAALLLLTAYLTLVSSVRSYTYIGCYMDADSRAMAERVSTDSMSAARCDELCSGKSYLYFGLEATRECWCGNSYGKYNAVSGGQCNTPCSGNSQVMCGGKWRLSIYATSHSERTGQRYIGCFADGGERDLPERGVIALLPSGHFKFPANALNCASACRQQNFAYYGLQAGQECWCGRDYGRHGARPETECNQPCFLANKVFCGAAWRNSVYATGLSAVQLPQVSSPTSAVLRGELSALVHSSQVPFPNEIFCPTCLIAAWGKQSTELKSRTFHVNEFNSVMAAYPERISEGMEMAKSADKLSHSNYQMQLFGNNAVISFYIGNAQRVGENIEMNIATAEVIAYLVPKRNMFTRELCQPDLFWTKCRNDATRERIGFDATEVRVIEQAMKSRALRLLAERV